jgi:hypothetical protein
LNLFQQAEADAAAGMAPPDKGKKINEMIKARQAKEASEELEQSMK